MTALNIAAYRGFTECVQLLLGASDILVNEEDNDGWSPLHAAARFGHAGCIEALVTAPDISVHAKDNEGRTPLQLAVNNGHRTCQSLLIGSEGMKMTLLDAALSGHHQSVEQFMQALEVLPREEKCFAINAALRKTRAEDGATPLHIAASRGNVGMMEQLLGAGAMLLAYGKHKSVREVLYSVCKFEDGMEITPLGIAARKRHVEAVTLLLEAIRQLLSVI